MGKQLDKLWVKESPDMKVHGVYSTYFGQYMIQMVCQFMGEPTLAEHHLSLNCSTIDLR
jgi:hypothetical protein